MTSSYCCRSWRVTESAAKLDAIVLISTCLGAEQHNTDGAQSWPSPSTGHASSSSVQQFSAASEVAAGAFGWFLSLESSNESSGAMVWPVGVSSMTSCRSSARATGCTGVPGSRHNMVHLNYYVCIDYNRS